MKGEMVAFIQKSLQTLILNAAFGQGSELLIDVAPGVDWTAIVAVAVASKQVSACGTRGEVCGGGKRGGAVGQHKGDNNQSREQPSIVMKS